MTTKKTSSIAKHKEPDLKLGREKLLAVINAVDPATCTNGNLLKQMIESIKLLTRMHHALQVDKVVARAEAKQAQEQKQTLDPEIAERLQEEVREILGRDTTTEIKTPLL